MNELEKNAVEAGIPVSINRSRLLQFTEFVQNIEITKLVDAFVSRQRPNLWCGWRREIFHFNFLSVWRQTISVQSIAGDKDCGTLSLAPTKMHRMILINFLLSFLFCSVYRQKCQNELANCRLQTNTEYLRRLCCLDRTTTIFVCRSTLHHQWHQRSLEKKKKKKKKLKWEIRWLATKAVLLWLRWSSAIAKLKISCGDCDVRNKTRALPFDLCTVSAVATAAAVCTDKARREDGRYR